MSINVNLSLVAALPSDERAEAVLAALARILADEGLDHDVDLDLSGHTVTGRTPYPLIISRFHVWHGPFEEKVRAAVGPDGTLSLDWDYPDGP
jgi:hypothetical protein